jgi:hypothetical protein
MLAQAREAADEFSRAQVRTAELDAGKVAEFRTTLLEETKKSRLIHDLFAVQGALREAPDGGPGERMVVPTFLPKKLLIAETNLFGLTHAARSLGRATRAREPQQLQEALEAIEVRAHEGDLATRLRDEVAAMAAAGQPATLLLIPASWRLREALGLRAWGAAASADSDLVPASRKGEFAGLFEEIPVLDLAHLPRERLWLVNLPAAATFVEWPSEQDSGIELELRQFDPQGAAEFLAEHPEVRGEGEGDEQALLTLQEQVLCRQYYCWRIEAVDDAAGLSLIIPPDLRR